MRMYMVHYYEEEYGSFSKTELAYDPAITPLGIYLKKTNQTDHTDHILV